MRYIAFLLIVMTTACAENTNNTSATTVDAEPPNTVVWDTTSAFLIDSAVVEDKAYIPKVTIEGNDMVRKQFSSYILMPYQYHGDEAGRVV